MAYIVENIMHSEVLREKIIDFSIKYYWFRKICGDTQTYVASSNLVNKEVNHHSNRVNINKLLKSGHLKHLCNHLSCV